jgi:hypothetical protein
MRFTAMAGVPGVCVLHDIAQPCVRLQRCLGKSPRRANIKDRQNSNTRIYMVGRYEINLPHKRIQWHSSQITIETGLNDREQRAQGPRKNKEGRMRSLRCAKLSATQAEDPPDDKQS